MKAPSKKETVGIISMIIAVIIYAVFNYQQDVLGKMSEAIWFWVICAVLAPFIIVSILNSPKFNCPRSGYALFISGVILGVIASITGLGFPIGNWFLNVTGFMLMASGILLWNK
jgi:hypothetical protein